MDTHSSSNDTHKLTVVLVSFNSRKFLPELFESLQHQTFKDFRVIVVDNHSFDDSVSFIRSNYPQVYLLENRQNLGFCKGVNQGIKLSRTPFILLCNPDIILTPTYLETVMRTMESDPRIASASGKLFKYLDAESPLTKEAKNRIIDSTGLQGFRSRRIIDRGETETDHGQFDTPSEVFGFSGALMCLRRQALEDIAYKGEYLDDDFFAYKDDADLAWRLRSMGYRAHYVPEAVAYHRRGIARRTGLSDRDTVVNRRAKPRWANKMSYRNHLLLLVKNLSWFDFFRHAPWIIIYELKKFFYILFIEPSTLVVIPDFFRKVPKALKKRRFIFSSRKVSAADLRKWFV